MLHLSVNSPMSKNAICLCNSLGIDVVTSFRRCVDYDTGKRIVCDSYCYEPKLFVAVRKNLEKSKETMVIANLDTKHIIGIYETVNGNTRVLFFPSMVYSDIIDLNNQGCRWEGDCQEGKPCGWGRYYDESNRLSYEGFRYDKFNVCYGTYYYKDTVNEQPKYKGQMAFNYKHGYGKLYDRTGALVLRRRLLLLGAVREHYGDCSRRNETTSVSQHDDGPLCDRKDVLHGALQAGTHRLPLSGDAGHWRYVVQQLSDVRKHAHHRLSSSPKDHHQRVVLYRLQCFGAEE